MIYWDNAASMPMLACAKDVLKRSIEEDFANSSSAHRLGKDVAKKIDEARVAILDLMKAPAGYDLIFTSSATEANNQIIKGFCNRGEVFYSLADHSSVTAPTEQLGAEVKILALDSCGHVDLDFIADEVSENTALVVLTHVNSQTGSINDIGHLASLIRNVAPNSHIHVDGVQALGKIAVELDKYEIDSYCVSAHKIGGPKGIAGLIYRKEKSLVPLLWGGGQERGLRSSTVASPLVLSFAAAAQEVIKNREKAYEWLRGVNQKVRESLSDVCSFPFELEATSPYILMLIVPRISSDILMRHLERESIYISTKSACSSKVKGNDSVLNAFGIEGKLHKSVMRISFGYDSTMSDVDFFVQKFKSILSDLNSIMR